MIIRGLILACCVFATLGKAHAGFTIDSISSITATSHPMAGDTIALSGITGSVSALSIPPDFTFKVANLTLTAVGTNTGLKDYTDVITVTQDFGKIDGYNIGTVTFELSAQIHNTGGVHTVVFDTNLTPIFVGPNGEFDVSFTDGGLGVPTLNGKNSVAGLFETITFVSNPVPEPTSMTLVVLGAIGAAGTALRRRFGFV